jgi:hypothetical protein
VTGEPEHSIKNVSAKHALMEAELLTLTVLTFSVRTLSVRTSSLSGKSSKYKQYCLESQSAMILYLPFMKRMHV